MAVLSYLMAVLFISCIIAHFQISGDDTGYTDDFFNN
jgi:hypothetical protein